MLGEFTREHKTDGGLNLSATQSRLLVVGGKLSGFGGDTLEDIVDEGVHDGHTLLGDTGIGVDLLKDLVDVRRVSLGTLLRLGARGRLLGCLSGLLGRCLGHGCKLLSALKYDEICFDCNRDYGKKHGARCVFGLVAPAFKTVQLVPFATYRFLVHFFRGGSPAPPRKRKQGGANKNISGSS